MLLIHKANSRSGPKGNACARLLIALTLTAILWLEAPMALAQSGQASPSPTPTPNGNAPADAGGPQGDIGPRQGRVETSPEDIGGMHVSQGILTTRGGMTSHAAVVARGMGTPCVCGAGDINVDAKAKTAKVRDKVLFEGDVITMDGATGEVFDGKGIIVVVKLHETEDDHRQD